MRQPGKPTFFSWFKFRQSFLPRKSKNNPDQKNEKTTRVSILHSIRTRLLVSFLGVSPGGVLESGMKKLNPDDLREILLNYEEVEQALAGTRFERLLVT